MASMETKAPFRSNRSRSAGMAMISLDFSSTASCPRTRRELVAKAETRCSGGRPALRSWLRRDVLPSMATRSACCGQHSATQARKQAENRSGSTRFNSVRSQSTQGMPWWKSEKRRRNSRRCRHSRRCWRSFRRPPGKAPPAADRPPAKPRERPRWPRSGPARASAAAWVVKNRPSALSRIKRSKRIIATASPIGAVNTQSALTRTRSPGAVGPSIALVGHPC